MGIAHRDTATKRPNEENIMTAEWYYQVGPVTASQLKQLANNGMVERETLIKKGEGVWGKANEVGSVFDSSAQGDGAKSEPPPKPNRSGNDPIVTNPPLPLPTNHTSPIEETEPTMLKSILGKIGAGKGLFPRWGLFLLMIAFLGPSFQMRGDDVAKESYNQGAFV